MFYTIVNMIYSLYFNNDLYYENSEFYIIDENSEFYDIV